MSMFAIDTNIAANRCCAPPFPEELQLRPVCAVVWSYVGDEADARTAMAPLLDSLPEPLLHGVAAMPHAGLQSAFDALYPKGQQWYWRADFVNTIPDEAVDIHQRFGSNLPTFQSTMHLYPIDGAAHDVGPEDTAWAYRDATWGSVFAGVSADPADAAELRRWTVDYFEALHPYSAGGAYVNMMMDEGQDRVRASYRGNYDRLARIKADRDPDNVFRLNQNVPPSDAVHRHGLTVRILATPPDSSSRRIGAVRCHEHLGVTVAVDVGDERSLRGGERRVRDRVVAHVRDEHAHLIARTTTCLDRLVCLEIGGESEGERCGDRVGAHAAPRSESVTFASTARRSSAR